MFFSVFGTYLVGRSSRGKYVPNHLFQKRNKKELFSVPILSASLVTARRTIGSLTKYVLFLLWLSVTITTFISLLVSFLSMRKGWFVFIVGILLSVTFSLALEKQPYHLKLLAVQEDGNGYQGSDADLYLELKEGSGRVFLETFPLTKLDTQISTRFAKDIACNHFKLNCDKYDFIYTIKAKSSIIGGPSAGAAIAALTTIAVLNLPYDQQVAITGTINSGGTIGPVGGVKEKLEAASHAGLKEVLIPLGTTKQKLEERKVVSVANSSISSNNSTSENNATAFNKSANASDLISYGKEKLNLHVLEVVDLDTVIKELTGVDLDHKGASITEDAKYAQIMKGLKDALCERGNALIQEMNEQGLSLDNDTRTAFQNKKQAAENASLKNDYYAAASYCFSNDILLRTREYQQQNLSKADSLGLYAVLEQKVAKLRSKANNESIETISDLQTLMVVQERLQDVDDQLQRIRGSSEPLSVPEMRSVLAYAEERFYSALAWYQFFSMDGTKFVLNNATLEQSCMGKITEGEERFQYVALFLGPGANFIEEKINSARKSLDQKNFALCLITAAQAKANADAIVSSLGVEESALPQYLESKRKSVERIISENSAKGIFPILGYSYYKYAFSLQDQDKYAALLYLEYALEMSDFSIYFPEKKTFWQELDSSVFGRRDFQMQVEGFVVGVLVVIILLALRGSLRKEKLSKKKG